MQSNVPVQLLYQFKFSIGNYGDDIFFIVLPISLSKISIIVFLTSPKFLNQYFVLCSYIFGIFMYLRTISPFALVCVMNISLFHSHYLTLYMVFFVMKMNF